MPARPDARQGVPIIRPFGLIKTRPRETLQNLWRYTMHVSEHFNAKRLETNFSTWPPGCKSVIFTFDVITQLPNVL